MAAMRMLRSAFFRPNLSISGKPRKWRNNADENIWMAEPPSVRGGDCDVSRRSSADRRRGARRGAGHPPGLARPAGPDGPGYPPPGGIYTQFTNCPLLNPIMQETPPGPGYPGTSLAYCVDGAAASGSITIGNITTPVVRPVNVQFGVWTPPNATNGGDNPGGSAAFAGGILPPIAGIGALLSTKPDLIPGSLTTVLGCATTTDPVVKDSAPRRRTSAASTSTFTRWPRTSGSSRTSGSPPGRSGSTSSCKTRCSATTATSGRPTTRSWSTRSSPSAPPVP